MFREKAGHRLKEHKRWEEEKKKKIEAGELFCKACGTTITKKHTYCPKCGNFLVGDEKVKGKKTIHKKHKVEKKGKEDLFKEFRLFEDKKPKKEQITKEPAEEKPKKKKPQEKTKGKLHWYIKVDLIAGLIILILAIIFLGPRMYGMIESEGIGKLFENIRNLFDKEEGRIMTKDYEDFGVTFETDSKTINEYTSKSSIQSRVRSDTTRYLTSDKKNIKKFANDLRSEAELRDVVPIDFIIGFVQSLGYKYDINTGYDEFPKYPDETLLEGNGDCEDSSYVLYSLLEAMSYDVVLLGFSNHAMVGVACKEKEKGLCGKYSYEYKGEKYYPIETTNEGWELGDLPKEYRQSSAKMVKNPNTGTYRTFVCDNREEKKITTVTEMVEEEHETTENCQFEVSSVNTKNKFSVRTNDLLKYGLHFTELSFTVTNEDNVPCDFSISLEINSNKRTTPVRLLQEKVILRAGESKKFDTIYDSTGGEEINAQPIVLQEGKTVIITTLVPKEVTRVETIKTKYCS